MGKILPKHAKLTMKLPKQIIGILKRLKRKGILLIIRELFEYTRKFRNYPKRFNQNINPIRWFFRMFVTYGNACFYYYDSEFSCIINFIPHDTNSWLAKKVCPEEYRNLTENKVVFFNKMSETDLPHVPVLFYKENDKTTRILKKKYFEHVIEKPIWGIQGLKVRYHKLIKPEDAIEGYIYQRKIENHSYLKSIANTKASNTIRVLTYLSNSNEVHILSALIRLSLNSGYTDNLVNGGIAVGINKITGKLNESGLDNLGKKKFEHPDGYVKFNDAQIPFWKEIIALSKKAALNFKETRLIGWDILLTEEGPVILEANRKSSLYLSQSQGELFYNSIYVQENMNL